MRKIFFDFDGTLVNISEKYFNIYDDFMRMHNKQPLEKEEYWQLKRAGRMDPSLSEQDVKMYEDFFVSVIETEEYCVHDILFPHVEDLLNELSKTYELYLLTLRHNKEVFEKEWKKLGIEHFFKEVICVNPLGTSMMKNYEVKAQVLAPYAHPEDVIVGDSCADILSGKKLGLYTIGVTTGVMDEDRLGVLHPDILSADILSIKSSLPYL